MTADQIAALLSNPWAYVFAAGFLSGMTFQRRLTRWTLGGKL